MQLCSKKVQIMDCGEYYAPEKGFFVPIAEHLDDFQT